MNKRQQYFNIEVDILIVTTLFNVIHFENHYVRLKKRYKPKHEMSPFLNRSKVCKCDRLSARMMTETISLITSDTKRKLFHLL